ncbi:ubiquinol-cytochrome c reductase iron-sulfur subunit [Micromonospora olivasterospora]|uniref:Cytochrome bc1 complex Rieske iron-sulfur subunit n=1 Tax=Micromonospora olivasterospora TaxID=1880 RepID=A0A562IET2_MICOL|nr:Rieske (2Fe-2S) protein [Micromonospora olivasterospora]TWH69507.1 ubiquinol-cytochrome c reductase iron-sulfur subunit [Micromonospora olivasterospora]
MTGRQRAEGEGQVVAVRADRPPSPTGSGASRGIVAAFLVSAAGAVGFAAAYGLGGGTRWEGVGLAVAFAGLAVGLALWGRHLAPGGGYVEEHEGFAPAPDEQALTAAALTAPDSPVRRRGLLAALGLALTALGAAALFPLRSLLPRPGARPVRALGETPWGPGVRLVDDNGRPLRPRDVPADTLVAVFPEGDAGAGDAPAFAVRLEPARFSRPPAGGHLDGLAAWSLLCTHAGCPVRLYLKGTGRILCPCHQSSFDLLAGARPVAGPAARALPGLPIEVGPDGFLRATGDFTAPPGAGFWDTP